MKKFIFTLKALYDIALSTEKQQKIQMKRIEERRYQLISGLDELNATLTANKKKQIQEMQRGVIADRLQLYSRYFESLAAMIVLQKEKIKQIELEREKCLEEQIKTRQEIKTLEKLREKQYQEYLLECKKEEEKIIGDLVSYKVTAS